MDEKGLTDIMPKLKIDNIEVEVPDGTNVLVAAQSVTERATAHIAVLRSLQMDIKKHIALFVLFSVMVSTHVFAEEPYLKYNDVFYPDGMPVISHTDSKGVTKHYQTKYVFISELDIPNTNIKVVLFTKVEEKYTYSDNIHHLYISLIQRNENVWEVVSLKDISNYLYPDAKQGGCDGILEYYNLENHDAIHLNVYSYLTGTGKFSGDSDVIFIIQDNEFMPIFELIGSADSGSSGSEMSSHRSSGIYNTFMYMADIDSDGSMDILTQDYAYEMEDDIVTKDELDDYIYVYKFDNETNKYEYSSKITTLPSDAVKLRRY